MPNGEGIGLIRLKLTDKIGGGVFADVFSPDGTRALKLFRRMKDPELAHAQPYIFRAETDAYAIVQEHPELQKYTAKFFGTATIESVENERGADVMGEYWAGLCYVMERLPFDRYERKFGSFFMTRSWPRMSVIERLFEQAGIAHLGDASVLHWRRKYPKLIDFAVTDAAADHWEPTSMTD